MPTYARCPECNASVPPAADWCSLCHTDLRAAPEPAPAFAASSGGAPNAAATSAAGEPAAPVRGRHREQGAQAAAVPTPGTGSRGRRHAAPGQAAPADPALLREQVDALVADAPTDPDGKPDLEVLTSQLMARLATSERRSSGLPDVDAVPGGKWGLLVGGMLAVAVVLVVLSAIVGAVFLR